MHRLLLLASLAACSSPSSGSADDDDAMPTDDASSVDAATDCTALGPCPWLTDYERRIVSQLAGALEIAPGVTIAHRTSIAERDTVRTFLLAEFAALSIPAESVPYTFTNKMGANIIATLAPTDAANASQPAILIGAHFDGVAAGPAAADNATGVAIVLAHARFLATQPRNRPIIFALFDQEELGLIGSKAYVASLVAANTPLRGVHIFDMLSFDGDGDHVVELWSPSPELQTLYSAHGPDAGTPLSTVTFTSGDHQAFRDRGFPAVGIGEEFVGGDHTPNYHLASDTVDNVHFDHTALVTHLGFATISADAIAP
jgi:hypothetical protein